MLNRVRTTGMPGYTNYRIAELQQLCAQRRIAYAGLRKRDLIRLLIDDEMLMMINMMMMMCMSAMA